MFVTSLNIKKQESYEQDAGQLRGTVVLSGATGKQEIILSSVALSRIFGVIAQEVYDRARTNAQQVKNGMEEAINSPLLLQSAQIEEPF